MNTTKDNQLSLTAFAEAIRAEETARSADVEAALDTLTREAREQDGSTTREDIERLVTEALEHDPQGEFASHFLATLQAEQASRDPFNQLDAEPSPQAATADQHQREVDAAAIDADPDPDLEDGPDFDDGPSYG